MLIVFYKSSYINSILLVKLFIQFEEKWYLFVKAISFWIGIDKRLGRVEWHSDPAQYIMMLGSICVSGIVLFHGPRTLDNRKTKEFIVIVGEEKFVGGLGG